jgi:hypothetical protein
MLLECGCGKMFRVRDGAANPPKNCPSCGGPLRQSGGAAPAPAPATPAAPPAADPRVKELEGRVQAFEREQGAARAAVELKEKELHEAQSSIARLGADLEKAQIAYKEALLKKDAELAERAAQATKLILAKDEALSEAREKIESLESRGGNASMEQELTDSREGKAQLVEELAKVESTYKDALKNKESEVDTLQKRVQDLEKQLSAASPKSNTPEGQRFQARIASLERIVQDGEQRYRALQKELDAVQGTGGEAVDARKSAAEAEKTIEERDAKIRELENRLKEAQDEADQARAKSAGASVPAEAPSGITATRLGEVRYLSSDLDRGLASISTALGGLVSRVRRLNESLADIPAVPVGKSSGSHRAVPPAPAPEAVEEEPEALPLVEPPSEEPDAPPELPEGEVEEPTPVDGVPQLESFESPEEPVAALPDDASLLDMGGESKPPSEETEPVSEEEAEGGGGKPKKGFFGKLFGKKKQGR